MERLDPTRDGGFGRGVRNQSAVPKESVVHSAQVLSEDAKARIWRRLEGHLPQAGGRSGAGAWGPLLVRGAVACGIFVAGISVGRRLTPEPLAVAPEPAFVARRMADETLLPRSLSGGDVGRADRFGREERATSAGERGKRSARARVVSPVVPAERPQGLTSRRVPRASALPTAVPQPHTEEKGVTVPEFEAESGGEQRNEPSAAVVEVPEWQHMANRGEYQAAMMALAELGGYEFGLAKASAEQLMLLADVARATGQPERAAAALRRVLGVFATDPVAPLAAWSLANLLEKSGDAVGAEQAFAIYRRLSPEGDFAADALLRQVRVAVSRRDVALAYELARQYEASFPNSEGADEVELLLSRLSATGTSDADAGSPHDDEAIDKGVIEPSGESRPAGSSASAPGVEPSAR